VHFCEMINAGINNKGEETNKLSEVGDEYGVGSSEGWDDDVWRPVGRMSWK